jgi:very-short-patch-repair endonuclease
LRSKGEECLALELERSALPGWDLVREHRFHPTRAWRFDFAWPSQKLAVEVDGRRHRTCAGQRSDSEKLNEATRMGWRVLRFPSSDWRKAPEWAALAIECLCFPPS